ncbi:HAD family hydrolase [Clostridium sp. MB40-C1]|uniref:HAD family hydrolase n=1 Tax=Clostridium sp. MB40-C1 TaxID=3070996 RepID=UPI0027DF621D|nr:HAD family hydrolase [Clostridium sp. MB40-C1]WMJ79925.1 HAD family hydrolase [Clostridium sp. MB40-C1]
MDIFKNIKTVFFDYDGTIHNSMHIYKPALQKAYNYIIQEGVVEDRELKDEEIKYWLGFNSIEMWKRFIPNLPKDIKTKAKEIVGDEMKKLVREKKAVLYEGALETLSYLKEKGYHLVFVSNCGYYYRDIHNKAFNLEDYFEEMACAEEYKFIPKYEYLKEVIKKYPKDMVMVGDRHHDIKAGKFNHIYTIGCDYGFATEGELKEADIIIRDINEIKKYL